MQDKKHCRRSSILFATSIARGFTNMTDETGSHTEAGSFSPSGMGRIWIELLTKATLCAAVIGFLAMMAVALLSSL